MEEIFKLDDAFQEYLQDDHYTFIGPENPASLDTFIKTMNRVAPSGMFGTLHTSLRNREAARNIIHLFANEPVRIYVVIPTNASVFMHSTIEGYSKKLNIQYP